MSVLETGDFHVFMDTLESLEPEVPEMEQRGCLLHGAPAYAERERSAAPVAGGAIPRRHPES